MDKYDIRLDIPTILLIGNILYIKFIHQTLQQNQGHPIYFNIILLRALF